jgi:hypothetical protein
VERKQSRKGGKERQREEKLGIKKRRSGWGRGKGVEGR